MAFDRTRDDVRSTGPRAAARASGLSALETAVGLPFDVVEPEHSAPVHADGDPFRALRSAMLPALRSGPCLVAFSGGLDSSLVLAAATSAARDEGLRPPLPVTLRFRASGATEEQEYQERVVAHLGLTDWDIVTLEDDLDLVGPVAQRHLLRHGVLFPSNCHAMVPLIERARGGTLMTGHGGDHLMCLWPGAHLAEVLARRVAARPRDGLRLAAALAPRAVRRTWLGYARPPVPRPWLTPDAAVAYRRTTIDLATRRARTWASWLDEQPRLRRLRVGVETYDRLGADHGARVQHPLLDRRFVASLGRLGGRWGAGDRNRILATIAGEALPAALVARTTKAIFDAAFVTPTSLTFAERWDGRGLDTEVVDPERVRAAWTDANPYPAALLLQAAWLADHG